MKPKVLIHIGAKNCEKYLLTAFNQVFRLDYPKSRISIAITENDSEDSTYEALENFWLPLLAQKGYAMVAFDKYDQNYKLKPEHRHLPEEQPRRTQAIANIKNFGVNKYLMDHDYYVFLDVHVEVLPPNILKKFIARDVDLIMPVWKLADGTWYDKSTTSNGVSVEKLVKKYPHKKEFEVDKSDCNFLYNRRVFDYGFRFEREKETGRGTIDNMKLKKAGFKTIIDTSVVCIHSSINGTIPK